MYVCVYCSVCVNRCNRGKSSTSMTESVNICNLKNKQTKKQDNDAAELLLTQFLETFIYPSWHNSVRLVYFNHCTHSVYTKMHIFWQPAQTTAVTIQLSLTTESICLEVIKGKYCEQLHQDGKHNRLFVRSCKLSAIKSLVQLLLFCRSWLSFFFYVILQMMWVWEKGGYMVTHKQKSAMNVCNFAFPFERLYPTTTNTHTKHTSTQLQCSKTNIGSAEDQKFSIFKVGTHNRSVDSRHNCNKAFRF